MSLTIDASVHVSNLNPPDVYHRATRDFFAQADADGEEIDGPVLVLPETAGAVARVTRGSALGAAAAAKVALLPRFTLLPLTDIRAERAAELAAKHFLRGADSIYVQVAEERQSTLVTWDVEMLSRASAVVATMTPTDWLSARRQT